MIRFIGLAKMMVSRVHDTISELLHIDVKIIAVSDG